MSEKEELNIDERGNRKMLFRTSKVHFISETYGSKSATMGNEFKLTEMIAIKRQ